MGVEQEARNVAPKSAQNRKEMSYISPLPLIKIRPLIESSEYAAGKGAYKIQSIGLSLPGHQPGQRTEKVSVCLGSTMKSNSHRLLLLPLHQLLPLSGSSISCRLIFEPDLRIFPLLLAGRNKVSMSHNYQLRVRQKSGSSQQQKEQISLS